MDDFCYEREPSRATAKLIPFALSKKMNCMYCGMSKGTCLAKVTLNSEKIKPIALAVIELCLSEGISRLVTQSVSQSVSH